ncbi:MAG: aspartate--tRNA ligase, partial [Candidatus Omnitrophica bacterium]|nr:aspartate--tRNA ligase [Candidatus Omnitrophota bacterium]
KDALPGKGQAGDVVFFAADKTAIATKVLGALRGRLGKQLNLIEEGTFKWTWITDFPLFHYNEEEKRWESEHHPFTSPNKEDIAKLGTDNGAVRSSSYDLVLNGNEIASGSIRIHDKATQQKIFDIIGLEPEETLKRFGFLLRSFEYGPPPHAGIALGLDRLLTIFLGRESIRDVIAFPKTQRAICPMTSAPSDVPASQLKELSIRVA